MIKYIRETRTDPEHGITECLVVDTVTEQYYIVSTLQTGRRVDTQVYRTSPDATGHSYFEPYPGVGGDGYHRCRTIRALEARSP